MGGTSYYNSMAVKLRKERGQDLDGFMQSFMNSIEQEADIGEDIASTQLKEDENRRRKMPNLLGNSEVFKNLFNIPTQSRISQYSVDSHLKTASDCLLYFMDSLLKLHKVLMKLACGVVELLPDSDNIILELIRKFLRKHLSEAILATLVRELEEKVFDSKPSLPPTPQELEARKSLAKTRIEAINKNLTTVHGHLQNPVLNKNLFYCLLDLIIVELFPELNLAKD
jgi:hypothetical protein